jgi:hypothetical protein
MAIPVALAILVNARNVTPSAISWASTMRRMALLEGSP